MSDNGQGGSIDGDFERLLAFGGLKGDPGQFVITPLADPFTIKTMGAAAPSAFSITPARAQGKAEADDPMVDSWTVYACLRLLSRAVSAVTLRLYMDDSEEAAEVPETNKFATLLRKPNPQMSWSQFVAAGITHRKMCGEDFWFLMDENGQPCVPTPSDFNPQVGLKGDVKVPMPAQILSVIGSIVSDQRDGRGLIRSWSYGGATQTSPIFPRESVIQFNDYNPKDPQRGLGDVMIAQRHVQLAFQADRYQDAVMRGGGPGAFLIRKGTSTDPREIEREQRSLDSQGRDPMQSRKLKILEGDWDVIPNPATAVNLGVFEQMRYSREVICSILNVPPPCIGLLEEAKYSNMEEAWAQMWLAVVDYLRGVADVINTKLMPNLEDPTMAKFRVGFDIDEIDALKHVNSKLFTAASDMAAKGVGVAFNDACEMYGLDIEGKPPGDLPLYLTNLTGVPPTEENANKKAQNDNKLAMDLASHEAKVAPKPTVVAPKKKVVDDELVSYADEPYGNVDKLLFERRGPMRAAERDEYSRLFEFRILREGDRALYRIVNQWLGEYGEWRIRRLEEFAETGVIELQTAAYISKSVVSKSMAEELEALLNERRLQWESLLKKYAGPKIADVFEMGLRDAANEHASIIISMADIRVQEALANQTIQMAEGVTSTTVDKVRMAMLNTLGEPTNMGSLQQAVKAKLPELTTELRRVFRNKDGRALTIARTESAHAANKAKFLQYGEMGIDKVQWVTAHDDKVRLTHQELDGVTVSYGIEFKPGLRYPADENGSAAEVINCRCTLIGFKDSDPK